MPTYLHASELAEADYPWGKVEGLPVHLTLIRIVWNVGRVAHS